MAIERVDDRNRDLDPLARRGEKVHLVEELALLLGADTELAMPQENLDLVRTITTDWEHGNYSRTDWAHPEIEFVIADGPSPGTWTGLAGMAQGWGDFLRAWEHEFRCVVEGYRELDGERVLVLQHSGGRGKTSGLEVTQMTDEGSDRVSDPRRQGDEARRLLRPRARAHADLGLSEQDAHADS